MQELDFWPGALTYVCDAAFSSNEVTNYVRDDSRRVALGNNCFLRKADLTEFTNLPGASTPSTILTWKLL